MFPWFVSTRPLIDRTESVKFSYHSFMILKVIKYARDNVIKFNHQVWIFFSSLISFYLLMKDGIKVFGSSVHRSIIPWTHSTNSFSYNTVGSILLSKKRIPWNRRRQSQDQQRSQQAQRTHQFRGPCCCRIRRVPSRQGKRHRQQPRPKYQCHSCAHA